MLLFLALILAGCASTQIESIAKPDSDLLNYDKILIFCNFDNLKYRIRLESEIKKQFERNGKTAFKSSEVMPPLREYSEAEYDEIILSKEIELLVEIKLLNMYSSSGSTSSFMMPVGGFFLGRGSSEVKLSVDFDIMMYDTRAGEIVLKGTASSEDEDDEFEDCIESIFESLAEELVGKYFSASKN